MFTEGTTTFELLTWLASMLLVTGTSFMLWRKLQKKYGDKSTMPLVNTVEISNLIGLVSFNYFAVTIGCVILYFGTGPETINQVRYILDAWWLIEIFVFFNLITSYHFYTALRRIVLKV